MKKTFLVAIGAFLLGLPAIAQNNLNRPKLVVGIVIDQMRYDFLYRYQDRYGSGGFNRLLNTGFSAENLHIPYAQTVTAAGHASVYTGSVPALNGIMGNEWYDRAKGRMVYCVEDPGVKILGGNDKSEPMSPRNLWATTIADELRLATNFRSKVVGVAIKDRGSILPAGHFGNAYWYDGETGNFVTSDFYMKSLPAWVNGFNNRKVVDSLYKFGWKTLYPVETYKQSDIHDADYQAKSPSAVAHSYDFSGHIGKNFGAVRSTPHGNTITLEFAKAALRAEDMGKDDITDLLAISLSSPDYIGHQYGPNSVEIEDTYLKLDKELENFFNMLDAEVGAGQYLVFLTADHGVAHVPAFLKKNKYEVSATPSSTRSLVEKIKERFGVDSAIEATANYQIYLNHNQITKAKGDKKAISDFIISELKASPEVYTAFSYAEFEAVVLPKEVKEKFAKGYNPKLGGDIQIILKPGYFYGGRTGTTHGAWYPYDAHIPAVFMGWGVKPGRTNRASTMADFAPTLAALLRIQMPNASIGTPISEITDAR